MPRAPATPASPTELRALFKYDPETGELRWRCVSRNVRTGTIAGYNCHRRYRKVRVNGTACYVHRVIWAMMTGEWPDRTVDHIDGDPANNRWNNLRLATQRQNSRNIGLRRTNTSGFIGVSYDKANKLWKARCRTEAGQIHIGTFSSAEEAAAASEAFRAKHHGAFRRD